MKAYSLNESVVIELPASGDHQQRFIGLTVRQAHEHVTSLLEAINSAQGHEDAMSGRVQDIRSCPRCRARNITPRHKCKRVRA